MFNIRSQTLRKSTASVLAFASLTSFALAGPQKQAVDSSDKATVDTNYTTDTSWQNTDVWNDGFYTGTDPYGYGFNDYGYFDNWRNETKPDPNYYDDPKANMINDNNVNGASLKRKTVPEFRQGVLTGTLEGFRQIDLSTKNETRVYTLAKLSVDGGKEIVVNLGEDARLRQLGLKKGDEVTIRGSNGSIDDNDIIVVNTVTIDGRTFEVNRAYAEQNKYEREAQKTAEPASKK